MEIAIKTNRLNGSAFPLTFSFYGIQKGYGLSVAPLAIHEIADLVAQYAQQTLLVYGVDHCTWYRNDLPDKLMSIYEIAVEQGVPVHMYDQDNIAITGNYLPQLLSEFYHYNFHVLDCPSIPEEIDYIEATEKIAENKNENVFTLLKTPTVWIDSHDDCYLYLETTNSEFVERVIKRAIGALVNTAVDVDPFRLLIGQHIVNELLVKGRSVTIFQEPITQENTIMWPVVFKDFFGDIIHQVETQLLPDKYLILNTDTGECDMQDGDSA